MTLSETEFDIPDST